MKRKSVVVGALFLVCALLPGCTKTTSVSDTEALTTQPEAASTSTATSMPQVQLASREMTLKEKIEAVANDEYEASSEDIGAFSWCDETWVYIGNEKYCAGAVYPFADWTPEDIIASYTNETAPWARGGQPKYSDKCLWSPDYEHRFEIASNHTDKSWLISDWLYIDGHRTLPVDKPSGDISPDNMTRLYQSGEWDGELMYSAESPGIIVDKIDSSGRLVYYYDVLNMSDDAATIAKNLVYSWDNCYFEDYDVPQTKLETYIYPDLPGGRIDHINESYRDYRNPNGTYVSVLEHGDSEKFGSICIGAKVEWYKEGNLLQSWDLTPEKAIWGSSHAKLVCFDGECYFFHYDTLWHLLSNGDIEMVLDDIIDYNYIHDGTVMVFYNRAGEAVYLPPLSHDSQDE